MKKILLIFVMVMLHAGGVQAQTTIDSRVSDVESLVNDVGRVIAAIDEASEDDLRLVELNRRLAELSEALVDEGVDISPRLSDVRQRLDQLGSPPGPDAPTEPELVTEERTALQEERSQLNRLIGLLEKSSVEARRGIDMIAQARRDLFTNTLSKRYDLRAAFSGQVISDLQERWQLLERRVVSWMTFTWRFKSEALLGATFLALLVALIGLFVGRKALGALINRPRGAQPDYFTRLTTGFSYAVLPFLVMVVLLLIAFAIFETFGVLRNDISTILAALVGSIILVVLVWRLAEALFAPRLPNWRIIEVADRAAWPLKALLVAMALVRVGDLMAAQINGVLGHTQTVTIVHSLFTSIAIGALLIAFAYVRPFSKLDSEDFIHDRGGRWSPFIRWLIIGLGAFLIVSALAGFVGLSRYIAQQVVTTGAVLVTGFLGIRAAQAVSAEGALGETFLGKWLARRFGFSETAVDQAGLVLGVLMGVVVVFCVVPLLLTGLGMDFYTVLNGFKSFFTGITVGSITISITGIAVGIALFAFGYWLTGRIQKIIDRNVLERGKVETGARNSIITAIGYVGIAIAALVGVSAAGIDLTKLAFIAGALSLGIGFGLQNIVNNFVSGLILLAERPFKSGDIIEAGGFTGVVKKVNVRATEMELFDRKTVILPNSELINSAVSNWMHRNTLSRIEVPIGVAYGTDPQFVIDTLMDIVNDHPRILANPEPFVAFVDFGASSLDFVLYGYIAEVSFAIGTRSELRLEIVKRFTALDIEIPFPQRDVNVRMVHEPGSGSASEKSSEPFDIIDTSSKPVSDDE